MEAPAAKIDPEPTEAVREAIVDALRAAPEPGDDGWAAAALREGVDADE